MAGLDPEERASGLSVDAALRRISVLSFALNNRERAHAFRRGADAIRRMTPEELVLLASQGRLRELAGVGPVIERAVIEILRGEEPVYLRRLEDELPPGSLELLERLRGDCHVHSDWSDGHATIRTMALAANALGHAYLVLTDHSPRLKIARGLDEERLRQQLALIESLNSELAPFRILTGIEVDINLDGTLDQTDEMLSRLDIVVASLHSQLRADSGTLTERLLRAVANPHLDILGHCTGRLLTRRGRPESEFDAEAVFAACAEYGKAVEINCQTSRLDPPRRLLRLAAETGCLFSIDTDAHTPDELDWQLLGAARAAEVGIGPESIVNTWPVEALLGWAASHEAVSGEAAS